MHSSRLNTASNINCSASNAQNKQEIITFLKRKLEKSSKNSANRNKIAQEIGEILFDEAPWKALGYFKSVLQKEPFNDEAHALTGLCFCRLGYFQNAIVHFEAALQVSPRNPSYLHNLGHLLDEAMGQPRKAFTFLKKARMICPNHPEIEDSWRKCKERLQPQLPVQRKKVLNLTVWAEHCISPQQKVLSDC